MTGGQTTLSLELEGNDLGSAALESLMRSLTSADARPKLSVIMASEKEKEAHEACLAQIEKASGGPCLWNQ